MKMLVMQHEQCTLSSDVPPEGLVLLWIVALIMDRPTVKRLVAMLLAYTTVAYFL